MSEIGFELYYEYLNDEDVRRGAASEAKWRQKVEARQERSLRRIMSVMIAKAGFRRIKWSPR